MRRREFLSIVNGVAPVAPARQVESVVGAGGGATE